MPKPSVRAEVNNFVGGLITEASPLNFPPNASLDEDNFELNRDGTRDRRLGMDFEPNHALVDITAAITDMDNTRFSTFKWRNVAGIASNEFLVVQIERTLKIFNLSAGSISQDGLLGTVQLTDFPIGEPYSIASIEGNLVVAAGAELIAIVSYAAAANTFSVAYDRIKVRDSWGLAVTSDPLYEIDSSYRGPAIDDKQYYNIQNQSWGIPRKNSDNVLIDPVSEYFNTYSKYPSSSEVVWTGLQFQPVTSGVAFERIYPNLYEEVLGADVKASKGYYVIDLLRRGASRVAAYNSNKAKYPALVGPDLSPPEDISPGGASVVVEFAGRVFYSGFSGEVTNGDSRSPNLSNYVVFSQLVRNKGDFVKCYQQGDPTSRENTDLIDTDGGFIRVSGAKKILALIDLESALMVVADNGVWALSGGSDFGFSATNYKVAKISSFGGLARSSVVVEGGRAFFWSEDGIYAIGKDNLGAFTVVNITEKTIQTLYEAIPNTSKILATGVYDHISKKIRWLYKTGESYSSTSVTKELVLDTVLNVFYQNTIKNISPNSVELHGLFPSEPFRRGNTESIILSETDAVQVVSENTVVQEVIRTTGIQSVRYLVVKKQDSSYLLTFSYYNNTSFLDWKTSDNVGVDAKAYVLTGQQIAKDSSVAKQMPYLIMYFKRTEDGVTEEFVPNKPSGCLMRCQWDFANTVLSNKWSALVQTYRYRRAQYVVDLNDQYDNGFELIVSKSKVRGRGKAFSLYFETEPLKDCRIVGWSISLNGNTVA
jgi:hypothetical protein